MPDVILPVLNEVEALPWVLARLPDGYRAIVVDNGSSDGSGQCAAALGATVVTEPVAGFGSACWAGLMAASDDVVCFMDCDGSLDPADLPMVTDLVLRGEFDMVIGARVAQRGAWPAHARVANRFLAFEVRRRTGLSLRDVGPMRAARRHDLLGLELNDRRSGWPLEMVLKAHRYGLTIGGQDVPYRPRVGRSKVTGTLRGTLQAVGDMGALLT
jgi:glycosyltransferase involved in cell wall biosynthesis